MEEESDFVDLDLLISEETTSEEDNESAYEESITSNKRVAKTTNSTRKKKGLKGPLPSAKSASIPNTIHDTFDLALPSVDISQADLTEPLDLFNNIFSASVDYLHEFTLQRQRQRHIQEVLAGKPETSFKAIGKNKIEAFIGASLLMDLYSLNQLEFYWGRRGSLCELPIIKQAFTYERFALNKSMLYCLDVLV